MKSFINFLLDLNVWVMFLFSVLGAVLFSVLLGFILNALFYDGTNNLLMLGAIVIPAIDAPVFIILLIILIREHRKLRSELDHRVKERTLELEIAYKQLSQEIKERKEIEKRLLHAHKMESIGTLAGGIAHDFNNILSSVIGFTELSLDEVEKGTKLEENLQEVYIAGKRARDLVKQILTFARQAEEEVKPIQISTIAKEVLKLLRSSIPTTIDIRGNITSNALIMGDPINIHQILMNLCTNASYAMEKGGVLEVRLEDVSIDGNSEIFNGQKVGHYVKLTISDTGSGIPEENIESIFEPYFTTKPVGEGTGMGLAMVHGIVKKYGGGILVKSEVGKGSVFSVFFPITECEDVSLKYQTRMLPSGSERILLVDDELPIVKMECQALESLGYEVSTRTSSIEALALFHARPDDFDLVITDMTMPNMTGDELASEMMAIRPDIPVILCTGYSKQISPENIADLGIKALAYKPMIKSEMVETVRKVLDDAKRMSTENSFPQV